MSLKPPPDQDVVIVGATGDLAKRKLLPAFFSLHVDGLLPARGKIIGYARRMLDDEAFRSLAEQAVREYGPETVNEEQWAAFSKRLTFVCAQPEGFASVSGALTQKERLIYLSTPPSAYPKIARDIGGCGLAENSRVVIEKPFGWDLGSSRDLESVLHETFGEDQIFRIDHYLGKETVQNILVFRFGNSVFERVWHRDAIDHIQITVAESIGIEGRGAFYEEVGALRDIIQNHVFQVLSLLTMEPPISFDAKAVRDEKAKLLHAIRPLDPKRVVLGQYGAGHVQGEDVVGYRAEDGVKPDSETETFAALEVRVDNWRWAGVPIYLRTGKRLPRRETEIEVRFLEAPVFFFEGTDVHELPANHLTITIQPDESIDFVFLAKVPGPEVNVRPVHMTFSYDRAFMHEPEEAYERLLHDAMDGDQTLFTRSDGVDRAWAVLQPVLEDRPPVCHYAAGTWGPQEANELIAPRRWHLR